MSMNEAKFITTLDLGMEYYPELESTEIAIYHDPETNSVFGIDASFLSQEVTGVVLNPLQHKFPQYILLSEGDVDSESLEQFATEMSEFPLVQMLRVMTAIHKMNSKPDGDGGWIGTGLQRECERLGVTEDQFRSATAMASVFLSELEEA